MNLIEIIFIALSLAMDAFAVSITSGIIIKKPNINIALKIALFFGSFQTFMPVIGWFAGSGLREFISGFDHWIAFALLSLIGCRMVYDSVKPSSKRHHINPLDLNVLLMLSLATSIDALAVGVSFAFLEISIVIPIIVIGLVTFFLSFFGVHIGDRLGHFFENRVKILGGLILLGIGIKILIEHLN